MLSKQVAGYTLSTVIFSISLFVEDSTFYKVAFYREKPFKCTKLYFHTIALHLVGLEK